MILYVVKTWPSVSETFVANEVRELRRSGVDVWVLGFATAWRGPGPVSALRGLLADPRATLHDLRRLARPRDAVRYLYAVERAERMHRHVTAEGLDVRHVHAHFLDRPSDIARLLARRLGVTWSATAHADDAYAPLEPRLHTLRLEDAEHVHCASRSVQRAVTSWGPEVATSVVRCGVDVENLPPAVWSVRDGALRIVTTARLIETKGLLTCVRAAAALRDTGVPFSWTVIGEGPLRSRLASEVERADLGDRFVLAGSKLHAGVLDAVRRCDAFVLPCEPSGGRGDGIPVALMEAMALGRVVVSTPVAGIPELIDASCGVLVPPADAPSLAQALARIARMDAAHRARLGSSARAVVVSRFDLRTETSRLAAWFRPKGRGNNPGVRTDAHRRYV